MPVSDDKVMDIRTKRLPELQTKAQEAAGVVKEARDQFFRAYDAATKDGPKLGLVVKHAVEANQISWWVDDECRFKVEVEAEDNEQRRREDGPVRFYYWKDDADRPRWTHDADSVFDAVFEWLGEQLQRHALKTLAALR